VLGSVSYQWFTSEDPITSLRDPHGVFGCFDEIGLSTSTGSDVRDYY
jgi:hypothetical protein